MRVGSAVCHLILAVVIVSAASAAFTIWLLSGASATHINVTVHCTGGPAGTSSGPGSQFHNSGNSLGPTRDKIMVTVSVPAEQQNPCNRAEQPVGSRKHLRRGRRIVSTSRWWYSEKHSYQLGDYPMSQGLAFDAALLGTYLVLAVTP
jgi:hypothetical protein